jgi:hypothetical protein
MGRRKILVIGMFDSIHLARWLSQFKDQEIDFILFPSKKFKYLNFELSELFQSGNRAKFSVAKPYFYFKYLGFVDFILCFLFRKLKIDIKRLLLRYCLSANSFKYVHAIEIQGAGYLYASLPKTILDRNTLILTNYGSDIIFYRNFPEHRVKISSVLSIAKLYSAECQRDYEMALSMGFMGKFLPCIPNAGGFIDHTFDLNFTPSEERNLIVAKCYGGVFGLGGLVIDALSDYLVAKPEIKVIIYSVTDDLLEKSNKFKNAFPNQVRVFRVREKIPRSLLLSYLSKARIYIGASRSDGISTSFLEALCLGAYPIQTDTSCANDWVNLGFVASIIKPSTEEILEALKLSYFDRKLNEKRIINLINAKQYLDFNSIKSQALKFYGLSA